jgi:nucleotide-binding universal stress UspA family protein
MSAPARRSPVSGKSVKLFRHIIVPVDLTPKNSRAVLMAARLASPGATSVTLLHVIELIRGIPFEELKTFYQKLENTARREMTLLGKKLGARGIRIEIAVSYGIRVNEIVNYGVTNKVDLIIMSSHRVNLKRPAEDWGSISHKVGILSQSPILLVK